MYMYMYIYIYVCMYVCMYIYIYSCCLATKWCLTLCNAMTVACQAPLSTGFPR